MRDIDALNRRYGDIFIQQYMVISASLHNNSLRYHPESYVVPSLHYLTRIMTAAVPPPTYFNASVFIDATLHYTMMSAPILLPAISTTISFSPTNKSEISLNQLVQVSLQAKVIPWVSIGDGFPMIPLSLSRLCTYLDFYCAGALLPSKDSQLHKCFPGTSARQYTEPGFQFLASRDFPVTC
jgi:hypothetical protein